MAEIPLKFSIFRYLFGFGITLNAYLVYNRQFPPPAMCLVYYSLCAMCITAVYHLSSHLMRRIPSCGNSLPAFAENTTLWQGFHRFHCHSSTFLASHEKNSELWQFSACFLRKILCCGNFHQAFAGNPTLWPRQYAIDS